MTKEKSWTRRQYNQAYRTFRRTGEFIETVWTDPMPQEIIRAADYSYQARDYHVNGWTSDLRRIRFNVINWRILTRREVYPF